ncbi:MAG TPA: AMP-binding protein [Candidatus Obscuribacterales bacterium]
MNVFTRNDLQYSVIGPRVFPTNAFEPFDDVWVRRSLHLRFEEQVARHPRRRAIYVPGREFSYEELNAKSNQIARVLVNRLGEAGKGVALFMEQGAMIVAAILGILKAGKFYVPLNAVFASQQNKYMAEDAGVEVVVTNNRNVALCEHLGVEILNLDEERLAGQSDNLDLQVSPEAVAYSLYTSGSTGRPKRVVQTHRNVLHNIRNYTNGVRINADDRLTLLSHPSFGASVSDIFGALLNGASLYPCDLKEQGFEGLARLMMEQRITIYHSVPSVYRSFLSTLTSDDSFPYLRLIKLGGETVAVHDVELYKKHFGRDCLLHVGLGSTEVNIIRQFFINHDTELAGTVVPVGYEVPGTEVIIVDDNKQAVEAGTPGEIAVRSEYLPLGCATMYLTGDLGLMQPDGCLFHLGRKDFQVKIRGYRVDTTEIEFALKAVAGIREAVVLGQEGKAGETGLVAYVVADRTIDPAEMRRLLRERLPEYMIPSQCVHLDALPVRPNGKVDRLALLQSVQSHDTQPSGGNAVCMFSPGGLARRRTDQPGGAGILPALEAGGTPHAVHVRTGTALGTPASSRQDAGAPGENGDTSTEQRVAEIWQELLGIDRVGPDDNFFELGGDSLLGLILLASVSRAFNVDVPWNSFHVDPTIAHLAALIDSSPREDSVESSGTLILLTAGHSSNPPVFIVPGSRGDVRARSTSRDFISHLAPELTVYALFPRSADGKTPGHTDVPSMAWDYIEQIRKVQPTGPYFLVGECIGAAVAFEMARLLVAVGEKVALLAMIDGRYTTFTRWLTGSLYNFVTSKYAREFPNRLGKRLRFVAKSFRRLPAGRQVCYVLRSMRTLGAEIESAFHDRTGKIVMTPRQRFQVQYRRTIRKYRPGFYSGSIKLLLSHDFAQQPIVREWQRVAGGVEVDYVPGYHGDIVTVYAELTASLIKRFYTEALAAVAGESKAGRVHQLQR